MGVVRDLWPLIVICAVFFKSRPLYSQNLDCDPNDLQALLGFVDGLQSRAGWDVNKSANCCTWPGVSCNSSSSLGLDASSSVDSGRVVSLSLGSKRLVGTVNDSLGKLDQLRLLNLSRNQLKVGLPSSVLRLPNLEVLDFSFNQFTETVPETIDLPSIQTLDISQNSFHGVLPVTICANSTKIRSLNLSYNYFNGVIPSGFSNCHLLEELIIGTNSISGNISSEIFQLQRLIRLDLSANLFSGEIPNLFQSLKSLQFFIADSNQFTASIPSSLSNLKSLVFLNLRNNSLDGSINLNCSAMTSLVSLDLASNNFQGPLPANLPECRMLMNVNLAKNNFKDQIPDSFRNFQSLAYLSLSNSSLYNVSSALSILQECSNLTYLVLTLNFYDEELPSDPGLNFPNLRVLIIANGRLKGSVPQWLNHSTNLQLLDLSWNRLSGSIPPWFGQFQSLFYLDLSNNSLTGEIPRAITDLQSLIDGNNSLQDPSPDFPLFMKKNVSLRGYQYNQVSSLPPTIALGYNSLNGSIWPDFGKLKRLHILNLRNNFLSGSIPSELSGMTSLESLDLSYNNLSGTLPASLASLNFLSMFSVAYNNLSGPIPTGTQFATFPNSSFEGTHLCGDHAPPCPTNKSGTSESSKQSRNIGVIVSVVVGILFGVVLLSVLVFLIVRRKKTRGEVDPEKDDDGYERDTDNFENSELRLLVMFQDKDNDEKLVYADISRATNNFDQANIIGCGGFGMVYKAILPDGRKLAIKKLSGDCGQMEREFRAEVETLSRAQHPNLVHLEGYCMDKDVRLLIYSYMENSSLDYWLHEKPDGPSTLDWKTRLRIAQGAARGLAYLHQSCEPHILHRDIKSSNILLDENFEAHLADFGLARLICAYDTHVTTDLVGTLGYIPPEYGQASVATYKGDVYSFGVVLLELLTGKRPMDICKPKGTRDLISWVIQMKQENKESEVFDQTIYGKQHDKEILRVFEISCLCLSDSPKVRPSTQLLVSCLEKVDANS